MKKFMIAGLILILGFVLMMGCNPGQPTQPQGGEQKPPAQKSDAPPPPPGSPQAGGSPLAPPANDLPYLFTKVVISAEKDAKDEVLTEETDMIYGENVGTIAIKVEKNKDIPKDKEFDYVISNNGKTLEQFTIKAGDLADKDKIIKLKPDSDKYMPGPYEVQITEKDSGKKVILHFGVGEPGKSGEPAKPGMETAKPGEPGKPGMETGKPGKPGEPGMAPGKDIEKDGDKDIDEPGMDKDKDEEPVKKSEKLESK
jgi:hypothetical protein